LPYPYNFNNKVISTCSLKASQNEPKCLTIQEKVAQIEPKSLAQFDSKYPPSFYLIFSYFDCFSEHLVGN